MRWLKGAMKEAETCLIVSESASVCHSNSIRVNCDSCQQLIPPETMSTGSIKWRVCSLIATFIWNECARNFLSSAHELHLLLRVIPR